MAPKKKEWFEDWFDSHYYHMLYNNRDKNEAAVFIKTLVVHLKPAKGSNGLDLACGKGRHAKELAKYGLIMTGVDLAANSIAAAKKDNPNQVHFDVHDMRKVYKANAYNYVFNLFTSFGYFNDLKENLKMLKSIYASLKDNGRLIIDFFNAEKVISSLKPTDFEVRRGIEFRINRFIDDGKVFKRIKVNDKEQEFEFQEQVQLVTEAVFDDLLRQSGFKVLERFGSYNLAGFDTQNSNRLIMVAQKL